MRDDDLLILPPIDAVFGGDVDRAAMRHVELLGSRAEGQQRHGRGQQRAPHGEAPFSITWAGPAN